MTKNPADSDDNGQADRAAKRLEQEQMGRLPAGMPPEPAEGAAPEVPLQPAEHPPEPGAGATEGEGDTEEEESGRPTYPGGKAALRLLQLVESSGHTAAMAAVADAAAPVGSRDQFLAVASQFSAAPAPEAS